MVFLQQMVNTNLQQALQMSGYTWGVAVLLGVFILLFAHLKMKSLDSKLQLYQISIIILAPYTLITGLLWFYYFTLVLCLPFFVLQLLFTIQFYRLNPSNKMNRLFIGLAISTVVFSISSALFFGII